MRIQKKFKSSFWLISLCALGLLLFSPIAGGAEELDATDEGLEISGLILDETKTKPGRDFYEYFTTYWQEVKGIHYTISVSELPDSTRGSFIFVKVNDTLVYQKRLNPRPDIIEQEARRAVSRVGVYMFRQMITQQQLEGEFQY